MPEHNHIVMSIIIPLPLQPLKMEYHMCNTAAFLAACVKLGVPQDKVGLVQPCSYWTTAVDTIVPVLLTAAVHSRRHPDSQKASHVDYLSGVPA